MEGNLERIRGRLREIYRCLTGVELVEASGHEPIPSHWDAAEYVRRRWLELEALVARLGVPVAPLWSPRVDVLELESEYRFDFEVGRITRDDVSIGVEGGQLVIEGHRRPLSVTHHNGYGYRWQEIPTGLFRRAVPLPAGARMDQLDAKLEDGVLSVRLPLGRASARKAQVEIH